MESAVCDLSVVLSVLQKYVKVSHILFAVDLSIPISVKSVKK
jgi:hypothetical protein